MFAHFLAGVTFRYRFFFLLSNENKKDKLMCSKYQCAANDDDDDVQVHLKKIHSHTHFSNAATN